MPNSPLLATLKLYEKPSFEGFETAKQEYIHHHFGPSYLENDTKVRWAEYELALLSSLPQDELTQTNDLTQAKEGVIYLSEKPRQYYVKGMEKEADIPEGINLSNLKERLRDSSLKEVILDFTAKKGRWNTLIKAFKVINPSEAALFEKFKVKQENATVGNPNVLQLEDCHLLFESFYFIYQSNHPIYGYSKDSDKEKLLTQIIKAIEEINNNVLCEIGVTGRFNGILAEHRRDLSWLNTELYRRRNLIVQRLADEYDAHQVDFGGQPVHTTYYFFNYAKALGLGVDQEIKIEDPHLPQYVIEGYKLFFNQRYEERFKTFEKELSNELALHILFEFKDTYVKKSLENWTGKDPENLDQGQTLAFLDFLKGFFSKWEEYKLYALFLQTEDDFNYELPKQEVLIQRFQQAMEEELFREDFFVDIDELKAVKRVLTIKWLGEAEKMALIALKQQKPKTLEDFKRLITENRELFEKYPELFASYLRKNPAFLAIGPESAALLISTKLILVYVKCLKEALRQERQTPTTLEHQRFLLKIIIELNLLHADDRYIDTDGGYKDYSRLLKEEIQAWPNLHLLHGSYGFDRIRLLKLDQVQSLKRKLANKGLDIENNINKEAFLKLASFLTPAELLRLVKVRSRSLPALPDCHEESLQSFVNAVNNLDSLSTWEHQGFSAFLHGIQENENLQEIWQNGHYQAPKYDLQHPESHLAYLVLKKAKAPNWFSAYLEYQDALPSLGFSLYYHPFQRWEDLKAQLSFSASLILPLVKEFFKLSLALSLIPLSYGIYLLSYSSTVFFVTACAELTFYASLNLGALFPVLALIQALVFISLSLNLGTIQELMGESKNEHPGGILILIMVYLFYLIVEDTPILTTLAYLSFIGIAILPAYLLSLKLLTLISDKLNLRIPSDHKVAISFSYLVNFLLLPEILPIAASLWALYEGGIALLEASILTSRLILPWFSRSFLSLSAKLQDLIFSKTTSPELDEKINKLDKAEILCLLLKEIDAEVKTGTPFEKAYEKAYLISLQGQEERLSFISVFEAETLSEAIESTAKQEAEAIISSKISSEEKISSETKSSEKIPRFGSFFQPESKEKEKEEEEEEDYGTKAILVQ